MNKNYEMEIQKNKRANSVNKKPNKCYETLALEI